MDVPAMSLELHERGIHAVRSGAGEAGVTEVRFRCALRPMATRGRTKIKIS
jgi:hypothetical protein